MITIMLAMLVWWELYVDNCGGHSDSDTEADYDIFTIVTSYIIIIGIVVTKIANVIICSVTWKMHLQTYTVTLYSCA